MLTGSGPGRNVGFGMVTSRMVDLLHRTKLWARVIAFISFLGVLALLAVAGLGGVSPEPVVRGFAGILALIVLLLVVPLYRFARAVEQIVPSRQRLRVASVFEPLESFWRRAGITGALSVLAIGGCLFVVWRARSDPWLAGFVASVLDPQGTAQEEQERRSRQERELFVRQAFMQSRSPLFLKPARLDWSSPRRSPPPELPEAPPGRVFTFEQIGEACPLAAESFLCLLNRSGEEFGGGNRQVITGADARFSMGSKARYDHGQYLEVVVEREGKGKDVRLGLAAPEEFPLMKMMYPQASGSGFGRDPFLFVTLSSQSACNRDGKFRVVDLAWGADGLPDRLVVDFEQPCGGRPPVVGRLSVQDGSVG